MSRRARAHLPRGPEPKLVLALLAIVGSAWVFLGIGHAVDAGTTQAFDEAVVHALRDPVDPKHVIGSPIVGEIARDVTSLGSVTILTLVTLAVVGFLALAGLRHALLLVAAAAIGGASWTFLLKELYARERPILAPDVITSETSFPSGHSSLSAVVYLTLAALLARLVARHALRVYVLVVAALATLAVGVSRVALGMHFPSDVLAGWVLGLAWAMFCWTAMGVLQRRGAVETVEEAHGESAPPPGTGVSSGA